MRTIHVEASHTINARPEVIYAILSDYRVGHPAILPKPYFSDITLLKGGQGAGTEITFTVDVFGTKRVFNQIVTEPEPGRVLMEAERDGTVATRFIVDSLNGGTQSHVTISTEIRSSSGLAGMMERIMVPLLNRYLYNKELHQLADYVQGQQA
jgi:hypothetical protein